ncbi:hypothetical protein G4177_14355 [Corallococcus sp. ZKHCc1 1396]|uniref:Dickkopf N-terminal cysteine-rich domain-containing protein n=1 Tax=Corallococcus soli TaxID=2710757 RepID=A0ABR9PN65_9BACT|nr:hypothetical protein [Corallococcus soli]MBE4749346.1 hypothetical protein [Corallococcus soli]
MKLISKTVFASIAALFIAPMTAVAGPNPCEEVCTYNGSCSLLCDNGGDYVRCGDIGVCGGALQAEPSEPQAAAQPVQDAELVCRAPSAQARG